MKKLRLILDKLSSRHIVDSVEEDKVNNTFICALNKNYYKEYDYLKEKFVSNGYYFQKFDLSLKFIVMRREDKNRLDTIDDCFSWALDSIKDMVDYHNTLSSYHLSNTLICANEYGEWDLESDEGKDYVLTELKNLERLSLNFFTLSNILRDAHLSDEEYVMVVKMIYNCLDKSNHNMNIGEEK